MQAVEVKELSFNPRLRAKLLQAQYLTTAEVLLTPPAALSRRAKLSPAETSQVLHELSLAVCTRDEAKDLSISEILERDARDGKGYAMTTGDAGLDDLLGGGIRTGSLTEVAGHSSSGKTHFCLQTSLTCQLAPELGGLSGSALFISSEGTVPSTRLFSLAEHLISTLPPSDPPLTPWDFLDNVHTEKAPDVETLEAVLSYHTPAAIERINALAASGAPPPSGISPFDDPLPSQFLSRNRPHPPRPTLPVRLIIVDSIAAPFRAETETGSVGFAQRAKDFANLGDTLKRLAHVYGCAVVVINQVTDVFDSRGPLPPSFLEDIPHDPAQKGVGGASQFALAFPPQPSYAAPSPFARSFRQPPSATLSRSSTSSSSASSAPPPPLPPHQQYSFPSLLYSRFQSPHFTGASASSLFPSAASSILPFRPTAPVSAALGHSWSNIPNVRVLCLLKRPAHAAGGGKTRRAMTLVFSPYAPRGAVEYEISEQYGVRTVGEVEVRGPGLPPQEEEEGSETLAGSGEAGMEEDDEARMWRELDGTPRGRSSS
ncbi:hypothetical protein JCM10213_002063 [Rhodosporidiobolus nylandii]